MRRTTERQSTKQSHPRRRDGCSRQLANVGSAGIQWVGSRSKGSASGTKGGDNQQSHAEADDSHPIAGVALAESIVRAAGAWDEKSNTQGS